MHTLLTANDDEALNLIRLDQNACTWQSEPLATRAWLDDALERIQASAAARHLTVIDRAGIGLSLARRLVEPMQGRLGLHSAPGLGSAFWIELPLAGPRAEDRGTSP